MIILKDCPFCNIELEKKQKVVLKNKHCMFLQMPQEVLIGSGIIIPIKHRETVFDLTKEEWAATFELLKEVNYYLDEKYEPDGYNVGWNCYEAGGQEIKHAHLHVIPRYKDEPYANKGIRSFIKSPENKRKVLKGSL